MTPRERIENVVNTYAPDNPNISAADFLEKLVNENKFGLFVLDFKQEETCIQMDDDGSEPDIFIPQNIYPRYYDD